MKPGHEMILAALRRAHADGVTACSLSALFDRLFNGAIRSEKYTGPWLALKLQEMAALGAVRITHHGEPYYELSPRGLGPCNLPEITDSCDRLIPRGLGSMLDPTPTAPCPGGFTRVDAWQDTDGRLWETPEAAGAAQARIDRRARIEAFLASVRGDWDAVLAGGVIHAWEDFKEQNP